MKFEENANYSSESINRFLILNEVGDDMIEDMISAQLENPLTHNIFEDYLTLINDREESLREDYEDDSDFMKAFLEFKDSIYNKIRQAAQDRFGITINSEGDDVVEKLAIENIYRIFFLEYQDTIKNLITSYIYKNRKGEIQSWVEAKKDIFSSSARKTYKDTREALIMSNISLVISKVLDVYMSDDECVEYMQFDNFSPSIDSFIDNFNGGIIITDNLFDNLKTPYVMGVEDDASIESVVRADVQKDLYDKFQTEEINIVGAYDPTLINTEE